MNSTCRIDLRVRGADGASKLDVTPSGLPSSLAHLDVPWFHSPFLAVNAWLVSLFVRKMERPHDVVRFEPGRCAGTLRSTAVLLALASGGCVGEERDTRERLFAHGECMVIEGELGEVDEACRGSAARCFARGVELVGANPQSEFTGRDCSELLPNGMKFTGGPCDVLMGAHCAKLDALGMSLTMKTTTLLEECVWYDLRKRDVVADRCQSDPATSAECAVLHGVFDRLQECFDERGPQRFPDGECFQIFRSAFWTAPDVTQECEVCPWWSSKECFEAAAGLSSGTGG